MNLFLFYFKVTEKVRRTTFAQGVLAFALCYFAAWCTIF
jgi:hypothetical protein